MSPRKSKKSQIPSSFGGEKYRSDPAKSGKETKKMVKPQPFSDIQVIKKINKDVLKSAAIDPHGKVNVGRMLAEKLRMERQDILTLD